MINRERLNSMIASWPKWKVDMADQILRPTPEPTKCAFCGTMVNVLPCPKCSHPRQVAGPIIAIDFDGTLVEHDFPRIGTEIPWAFQYLHTLQDLGARLILLTMRSDDHDQQTLREAVEFCERRGIVFWSVNCNPEQDSWSKSRKVYANVYVDDAALGCPLIYPHGLRPYVDWLVVGPMLLELMQAFRQRNEV